MASAPGVYFGQGDGTESGRFVARIAVSKLPNGGAFLEYEASSLAQGVQHLECTMLVPGPEKRVRLFIAHSESTTVTEMIETTPGSGRFEQLPHEAPYQMAVVIERSATNRFSYAWWWATAGREMVEQSRADVSSDVSPEV